MTRKHALTFLTVTFGATLAMSALSRPAFSADDKVEYKKETKYDFDDDTVEGDLVRPEGEMVGTAGKAKHSSLIKIRQNFIPEMLKSAEDI
jgi:hypothetical protein